MTAGFLLKDPRCSQCKDSGKCPQCDGTGINRHFNETEPKCRSCSGTGVCPECNGVGGFFRPFPNSDLDKKR